MARVREVSPEELTPELRDIWHRYVTGYGPFEEQLAVFAHVPAALRHLMPMLMELREAGTLPRRYLELAIVVVSKLNACDYCVDHHGPFLAVEGIPTEALEGLPGRMDHPSLTPIDRLVAEEMLLRRDHVLQDVFVGRHHVCNGFASDFGENLQKINQLI